MGNKEDVLIPLSSDYLNEYVTEEQERKNKEAAEEIKEIIDHTFNDFGVPARVKDYTVGPSVTRYNLELAPNCSIRMLSNLIPDIQIRLGGISVRYDTTSIGSFTPGLEVENPICRTVSFKELYDELPKVEDHPLAIPLGKKVNDEVVWVDLQDAPHMLVSGTTGSGKSIFINSMLMTLMMRNSPESLKFVLFDPKRVELSRYRDEPHLLRPIVHTADEAKRVLEKLCEEMESRYSRFFDTQSSNIAEYNEEAEEYGVEKLPYIVVVIDEYADLVDADKSIANPIISLAQKARAAGVHLVIATQRPSTNVVTGALKANMPTHIALMMASPVDSMTVIGELGAEKLVGRGDMLVQSPLVSRLGLTRLQGSFVHRTEITKVVSFFKEHYPKENETICESDNMDGAKRIAEPDQDDEEQRYQKVKAWVLTQDYMSISRIQRECSVGFNRAGRYFLRLQEEGVISRDFTNHGNPVIKKDN